MKDVTRKPTTLRNARGIDFTGTPRARLIEWLRLPGDLVCIFLGALPMLMAAIKG